MSFKELQKIISPVFTQKVLVDIVSKKSGLCDVQLTNVKIDQSSVKKGDAYFSEICRFTINATGKNADGQEESVFIPVIVKSLPSNPARRKTYRSSVFFEHEIAFYEKIWPAFQKFQDSKDIQETFDNVPLVLSSWFDGSNDYVAMLDVNYQGFKAVERGNGLDYSHSVAILRLLGAFHGLGLAFKNQQPDAFEEATANFHETYYHEKYRGWFVTYQKKLIAITKDAVEKELPPIYLEKLNKLIESDIYGILCKLSHVRGPYAVVTHGDVWPPNFLVKYRDSKPEKIIMVDYQFTRYTTIATDIAFFLLTSVDIDLLEQRFEDLLKEYYEALTENIAKFGSDPNLITFEALHEELKLGMPFGVGASFEALNMSLLDDNDVVDLDSIQGDEAVPIDTIWDLHPYKEQEKRQRIARMVKFAVDRNYI